MNAPVARLAAVLALALASVGCCGVGSTRTMWKSRWVEPGGPPVVHALARTGEVAGKIVLTPATVTVDVVTEPTVWIVALEIAEASVQTCACACR